MSVDGSFDRPTCLRVLYVGSQHACPPFQSSCLSSSPIPFFSTGPPPLLRPAQPVPPSLPQLLPRTHRHHQPLGARHPVPRPPVPARPQAGRALHARPVRGQVMRLLQDPSSPRPSPIPARRKFLFWKASADQRRPWLRIRPLRPTPPSRDQGGWEDEIGRAHV